MLDSKVPKVRANFVRQRRQHDKMARLGCFGIRAIVSAARRAVANCRIWLYGEFSYIFLNRKKKFINKKQNQEFESKNLIFDNGSFDRFNCRNGSFTAHSQPAPRRTPDSSLGAFFPMATLPHL